MAVSQSKPPSGITTITQKRGAPLPESPQLKSERYKLRSFAKEFDLEYKLLFHEFSDGKYKANERYLEVVTHRIIRKNETLIVELIPELHHQDRHLKIFINIPGMTVFRRKVVDDEDKCIKYIFFNMPEQTVIDSSLPVLLAYEDNRNTNEVESFLSKYVKGSEVLPGTERMLEIIKSNIAQYSLLFYTTKKMKNED